MTDYKTRKLDNFSNNCGANSCSIFLPLCDEGEIYGNRSSARTDYTADNASECRSSLSSICPYQHHQEAD